MENLQYVPSSICKRTGNTNQDLVLANTKYGVLDGMQKNKILSIIYMLFNFQKLRLIN